MNTESSGNDFIRESDWLKADMEKSDKPWKIVALHRGPYGATYDSAEVRDALTPAFDEAGIDLVLQGHDHNYVRTYAMNNKTEAPRRRRNSLYHCKLRRSEVLSEKMAFLAGC